MIRGSFELKWMLAVENVKIWGQDVEIRVELGENCGMP